MIDFEESIRILKSAGIVTKREAKTYNFGTFDECKNAFTLYFQKLDTTATNFQWLPEYDEIVEWLIDTQGKGLLLMGDCGRGKSTILLSIIPMMFFRRFNKVLHPISAKEINLPDPQRGKNTIGWVEVSNSWCIAIDELGTCDAEFNFGERYEPFNKIIDEAEKVIKLMLLSTNLTKEQLLNRYGERCLDRLVRLCRVIEFSGESFRK